MIEGIEAGIADALLDHLRGVDMPIVWPGVDGEPSSDGYLKASMFRIPTEQITLGDSGYNRHQGTLQVSVFWPRGVGEIAATEAADSVAAHFKRGTTITKNGRDVRIIQPPSIGGALQEPGWLQIPVLIRWQSDNFNP